MQLQSSKKNKRKRSTSRNKIDTKRKIIEAAYREFAEKGFDGARMQKIAERANINKAMLHYYYKDKGTLYDTVIAYFHELFNKTIAENNINAEDRYTFLKQTINAYYQIFFEYPEFKQIFIQEMASDLKTLKKVILRQSPKELKEIAKKFFLVTKIQELQRKNEIRKDIDSEHIMLSIVGLMEAALFQTSFVKQVLEYNDKRIKFFVEKRKEAIIKILDKGLTPE